MESNNQQKNDEKFPNKENVQDDDIDLDDDMDMDDEQMDDIDDDKSEADDVEIEYIDNALQYEDDLEGDNPEGNIIVEGDEPKEEVEEDFVLMYMEHKDSIYKLDVFEFEDKKNGVVSSVILTGGGDDVAHLWNVEFDSKKPQLKKESKESTKSDQENGSTTMVFADGVVINSPQKGNHIVLDNHKDTVVDVKFNFDGSLCASASMDNTVNIWSIEYDSQKKLKDAKFKSKLEGCTDAIEWIDWHPKGNAIVAGSSDLTAWVWNAVNGACLTVLTGHSAPVTCGTFICQTGRYVLTGSEDQSVRVWDVKSSMSINTFQGNLFAQGAITSIKSKPSDPNVFVCTSEDGCAYLADIRHQNKVLLTLKGHTDVVEAVDFGTLFGKEDSILATGSMDGKVIVWDLATGKSRYTLNHEEDGVIKVKFDQKNPILYSCGMDKVVYAWDIRTGELIKKYNGHQNIILDIAILNNSNNVLTCSDDQAALIFPSAANL